MTTKIKEISEMSTQELEDKKKELEEALTDGSILDPEHVASVIIYIRRVDFELIKRNPQYPVSNFSTHTIELLIEQNGEDELFQDSIQKHVLHDELLRRNK